MIPSVRPFLLATALAALERYPPGVPFEVIPMQGRRAHGWKLDAALRTLPTGADYLFTMDDDAAPLADGWLAWLIAQMGGCPWAGFHATRGGRPHPLGGLYSVPWLRAIGVSFTLAEDPPTSVDTWPSVPCVIAGRALPWNRPWWLKRADVAADETGRLLYAHLGGGTIGATSWRIPTRSWPLFLRLRG